MTLPKYSDKTCRYLTVFTLSWTDFKFIYFFSTVSCCNCRWLSVLWWREGWGCPRRCWLIPKITLQWALSQPGLQSAFFNELTPQKDPLFLHRQLLACAVWSSLLGQNSGLLWELSFGFGFFFSTYKKGGKKSSRSIFNYLCFSDTKLPLYFVMFEAGMSKQHFVFFPQEKKMFLKTEIRRHSWVRADFRKELIGCELRRCYSRVEIILGYCGYFYLCSCRIEGRTVPTALLSVKRIYNRTF